ncbi:MAG: hypothetical protein R3Y54_11675 [Eubacteriales bacterium]
MSDATIYKIMCVILTVLLYIGFVFLLPMILLITTVLGIFKEDLRIYWIPSNIVTIILLCLPPYAWIFYFVMMSLYFFKKQMWRIFKSTPETNNPITNLFQGLSDEEAKKKYRALMKEYHPDQGGDVEMAKKITASYKESAKSRPIFTNRDYST